MRFKILSVCVAKYGNGVEFNKNNGSFLSDLSDYLV